MMQVIRRFLYSHKFIYIEGGVSEEDGEGSENLAQKHSFSLHQSATQMFLGGFTIWLLRR